MHPLTHSIGTLAVATIYCIWRTYTQAQLQEQRTLRERVSYMLWCAASDMP